MKNIATIIFTLCVSLIYAQEPITASKINGCVPMTVTFSNDFENVKTYQWDLGNGSASSVSNPVVLYDETGIYHVQLTVVFNDNQTQTVSLAEPINVINKPDAQFTISSDTFCDLENIKFNNTTTGAVRYIWDFGDGVTSTEVNPEHSYENAGNYSITLVSYNQYGCPSVKIINDAVNVNKLVGLDFTSDISVACLDNATISFSALSSYKSWQWDFGDGTQSTIANPTHKYTQLGKYNVTLTAEDINGCTATLLKTNFVEIFAPPAVKISISQSVICTNGNVEFSNQTDNTKSIIWLFNDGYTSTDKSFVRQFSAAGDYSVAVTITNLNGCTSSSTFSTAIKVLDAAPNTIEISEKEGCVPFTTSFSNTTADAIAYKWEINGLTFTTRDFQYTFLNPGIYSIKATTEHTSGCTSILEYDTAIVVHESDVEISASQYRGCVPFETNFEFLNNNFTNLTWDFGNGDTSTLKSPSVQYTSSGVYEVKASFTNEYGCIETFTMDEHINVFDTLINYVSPQTVYACSTLEIYFTGEMGHDFWQWDFGDGTTSDNMNPTHKYDAAGIYVVSLVTNNDRGCQTSILEYNKIVITDIAVDLQASIIESESCPNFTVQLENLTNFSDVLWDFGDGTTSTDLNPTHNYTGNAQFSIKLTVSDSIGCSKTMATVISSPWPYCDETGEEGSSTEDSLMNFVYYSTIKSCTAPFEINFSNPKPNADQWYWYFGDGASSQDKNPSHVFEELGEYLVDLVYTNSKGETDSVMGYTTVIMQEPLINFEFAIQQSCHGVDVEFFNTDNTLVNWKWNLGNGHTSTDKDPTETYPVESHYQVSLDAVNSLGCAGKTVKNIVLGNPFKQYDFPADLCLSDSLKIDHNLQFYESYEWDFGDGTKQTATYPSHLYTNSGKYAITLKAIGKDGCIQIFNLPHLVEISNPIADFEVVGEKHGCNNLLVSFKNLSTESEEWLWNFGNGITSVDKNPNIEFGVGSYTVELIARKNGCSSTILYSDIIVVDSINVDFKYSQDKICLPATVTFDDLSTDAMEWLWDFGDGSQSVEKRPTHVFITHPTKGVTLQIKNSNGCISQLTKPLDTFFKSEFSADKYDICIPDQITFKSSTLNATVWFWDFGDGNTSSIENPTNTYEQQGEYTVKLITQSVSGCYDTLVQENVINAMYLKSNFVATVEEGVCAPIIVNFENQSIGATKYVWEFGDGTTSESKNPLHVYTTVGNFDVRLVASNDQGCSNEFSISNLVTTNGPQAKISISDSIVCDPAMIQFSDMSTSATKWEWFFGDGTSSETQNPEHQYAKAGSYIVSLLATDDLGCLELVKSDSIRVYPTPKANFSIDEYSQCIPFTLGITNSSTELQNETYAWDFGKGKQSTNEAPIVVYNKPGSHQISLTVTNEFSCSNTFTDAKELVALDTARLIEPEVFELSVSGKTKIKLINKPYSKNNFKYHIVYRAENTPEGYAIIDTIWNANALFYEDEGVQPNKNSYAYQIKSFAYCQDTDEPTQITTYKSILIGTESKENGITVSWTPYIGHSFDQYVVYRKQENTDWNKIGTVLPSETSFVDTEDLCPTEYTYKIVAENLNGLTYYSQSNSHSQSPFNNVFKDQKVEIVRSTVENEAIFTEWKKPEIGQEKVVYYQIWRSLDEQGYELIDQVPKGVNNYYDQQVDVAKNSYYYLVDIVNECDVQTSKSNLASSILLQKQTDQYLNRLFWSPYKEWPDGVSKYLIQRKNEFGEWETIETLPSTQKEFTIDLNEH
jgi:PKD repeat protein